MGCCPTFVVRPRLRLHRMEAQLLLPSRGSPAQRLPEKSILLPVSHARRLAHAAATVSRHRRGLDGSLRRVAEHPAPASTPRPGPRGCNDDQPRMDVRSEVRETVIRQTTEKLRLENQPVGAQSHGLTGTRGGIVLHQALAHTRRKRTALIGRCGRKSAGDSCARRGRRPQWAPARHPRRNRCPRPMGLISEGIHERRVQGAGSCLHAPQLTAWRLCVWRKDGFTGADVLERISLAAAAVPRNVD